MATLHNATQALVEAMTTKDIDLALSNAVKYQEFFGNVVIAWIWLKQGVVASKALTQQLNVVDEKFYRGKLQALRYFFRFELPEIDAGSKLLTEVDSACYDMQADWFERHPTIRNEN